MKLAPVKHIELKWITSSLADGRCSSSSRVSAKHLQEGREAVGSVTVGLQLLLCVTAVLIFEGRNKHTIQVTLTLNFISTWSIRRVFCAAWAASTIPAWDFCRNPFPVLLCMPVQTSSVSLLDGNTACWLVRCSSGPVLAHRSNFLPLPQIIFSPCDNLHSNNTVWNPHKCLFVVVCFCFFIFISYFVDTYLYLHSLWDGWLCATWQMAGRPGGDRGKEGAGDLCFFKSDSNLLEPVCCRSADYWEIRCSQLITQGENASKQRSWVLFGAMTAVVLSKYRFWGEKLSTVAQMVFFYTLVAVGEH